MWVPRIPLRLGMNAEEGLPIVALDTSTPKNSKNQLVSSAYEAAAKLGFMRGYDNCRDIPLRK